jgi:serine/threonine protein kinase
MEAEGFIEEPALNMAAKGMARNPTESMVGRQFGPYQILCLLGAGGMGEVYRARDNRLAREVAIKVLRSEFSENADRVGRFKQEARAVGQLNHPNILTLYDVGTYEASPYLISGNFAASVPRLLWEARYSRIRCLGLAAELFCCWLTEMKLGGDQGGEPAFHEGSRTSFPCVLRKGDSPALFRIVKVQTLSG